MKSKYVPRLLGTVVAAALLVAGAVTPVNAQDKIAIRIGVQAQTSWLLVTARELQLFEAEGLDPEYKKFTYGALSVQAMQAGEIDLATPGLTPFVAGIAQGVDWKMIGLDNNSSTSEGFVARKDTDIEVLEDFRGKRIGVTRGSTSYYGLLKALSNKGISKDEISLLILSPSDQLGAMLNGDVDGVAVWQPWIEKLKSVAGARTIGVESDYGVYTAGAAYAIGAKYLEENPEAARRFMRAIVKAYDYIQENGPDIPIRIIGDSMGLEKEVAQVMWEQSPAPNPRDWADPGHLFSVSPDGKFAVHVQEMADFMFKDGLIDREVTVASYFNDEVVAEVTSN